MARFIPLILTFESLSNDTKAWFHFQPPAFLKETPESIKGYIEKKYLLPRLDNEEFSPEKAGKHWDFGWFDKAKVYLEPSLPQSVVVPTWELPFRRKTKGSLQEKWKPSSLEVQFTFLFCWFKQIVLGTCVKLVELSEMLSSN